MTSHNCSRCGEELEEPLDENNDYVTGPEFVEETEEMKLTAFSLPEDPVFEEVKSNRVENALQYAFNENLDRIVVVELGGEKAVGIEKQFDELNNAQYFEIYDDFEYQIIESSNEVERIPEAVGSVMRELELNVQKTALICPECYKPEEDQVIWGVHDKE